MSFRQEFVQRIHRQYQQELAKQKSIDSDWQKIKGYMSAFLEDLGPVASFSAAKIHESETELALTVEMHELSFKKVDGSIVVHGNGDFLDRFEPTLDGYCRNSSKERIFDLIDTLMRWAFQDVMNELNG